MHDLLLILYTEYFIFIVFKEKQRMREELRKIYRILRFVQTPRHLTPLTLRNIPSVSSNNIFSPVSFKLSLLSVSSESHGKFRFSSFTDIYALLFILLNLTYLSTKYSSCDNLLNFKDLSQFKEDYELGSLIGEGSFAQVKLGINKKTGHEVAIKEVYKAHSDTSVLENEVKVLKSIGKHKNIISLIDVFDSKEALFIVTDLAHKGELFDWIIEQGELSETKASKLMNHAVQGIKHLHENNIIHLDIKPENLLLTEDMIIKIADFGLAIKLPGPEFHYVRTECVGTPAYWAPELVKNESFGKAVDIWSLGCVLYILLCGSHPFDPFGDASEAEILAKVVEGEYDVESPTYKMISPQAKDLIAHMLDPNPERRYSGKDVIKHPWMSDAEQVLSNKPLPLNHMAKLKAFRALQLMRIGLEGDDVEGCSMIFSTFDANNDGVLTRNELRDALKRVGVTFNSKEMDELLSLFKVKKEGLISEEEFKQTLMKVDVGFQFRSVKRAKNKLQHIKYLFDTLDKNKDGYIEKEDCLHLMDSLGLPQNKTKLFRKLQKFQTISKRVDDKIDFAEFVKFFRQIELKNKTIKRGINKKRTIKRNNDVLVRTKSGCVTKSLKSEM